MNHRYVENGLNARKVTRAIIKDKKDNYLFERRPDSAKFSPNSLQLFGGKVDEEDRTIESALIRELIEELHITPDDILSIESIGAELSPDEAWLSYFFVVVLKELSFSDLSNAQGLELLNQQKLKVESGPIIDSDQGGDIAFDHGQLILENS